jgi:predicted anti-sigma-YlaC factor YlaD
VRAMLRCRDMTELATDYMEGALPLPRRLLARWHLALCGRCRAYYDQLAKTVRLLRGRPLAGPDPATETRLLAARTGEREAPP